jgi:hypothetical protein
VLTVQCGSAPTVTYLSEEYIEMDSLSTSSQSILQIKHALFECDPHVQHRTFIAGLQYSQIVLIPIFNAPKRFLYRISLTHSITACRELHSHNPHASIPQTPCCFHPHPMHLCILIAKRRPLQSLSFPNQLLKTPTKTSS